MLIVPHRFLWSSVFYSAVIAILILGLIPTVPQIADTGWDKTNHLVAFAVLAWLGCMSFPRKILFLMLALFAFGALIEVLQSFTPHRSAEWGDLLADGLGLFPGWIFFKIQIRVMNSLVVNSI
jgi:VanZ family protein